jgi:hypothetical protein
MRTRVPVAPFYVPCGVHAYRVLAMGRCVAELWRGKSGWWVVTDKGYGRFSGLRDAEKRINRACERLDK